MLKVLIILGPTASGKSALAVELAKQFNGEVISADSRQIYRGLDIATGKITKEEMDDVPHHLLDVADPKDTFTASDFEVLGTKAIEDILSRGKLPIICGGTGFYIDSLIGRMSIPDVAPNKALRNSLKELSAWELLEKLRELDPVRAETIEQQNPARLIRAIEIATALGSVPKPRPDLGKKYDALWIGLSWPKEELRARLHARVEDRMKKGMITEAKELHETGLTYGRMQELGLEYRSLAAYLRDEMTEEELATAIEQGNIQYAKRQMTYWKRNPEIVWMPPTPIEPIASLVDAFLAKTASN